MTDNGPLAQLRRELHLARDARRKGNEGRARVCARRAAGIAARIYLEARGLQVTGTSVLDQLGRLGDREELSPKTKHRIQLLLLRVDPEFRLPPGTDLIAEAEALCRDLLNQRTSSA